MSSSNYLKALNVSDFPEDAFGSLEFSNDNNSDFSFNRSLSGDAQTNPFTSDTNSLDGAASEEIEEAISTTQSVPKIAVDGQPQGFVGDTIEDADLTFGESSPTNLPGSSSEDEIPIDDAPVIIVPDSPNPIVPIPSPVTPTTPSPIEDSIDLGGITGPTPEPPTYHKVDPITGTPFDMLIQQLLQSLNGVQPAIDNTPPPRSTQPISSTNDEIPRAAASAIASVASTEACAGLSELDELTLRLHDGFELRSGNNQQSAAQFLTNYGGDSDNRTFIRVTDRRNPFATSYTAYFEGKVQFGETFTVRAEAGGSEVFHSKIYLHYFDEENHNLLRTVQYSASCEVPVRINDELGGATVLAFN
jgi:hypothetical protein